MSTPTCSQRPGRIATLAVAAAPLDALAIPLWPVIAQPCIGWDFGNGIGIGTSPSAYEACPKYSWWYYPYCPPPPY